MPPLPPRWSPLVFQPAGKEATEKGLGALLLLLLPILPTTPPPPPPPHRFLSKAPQKRGGGREGGGEGGREHRRLRRRRGKKPLTQLTTLPEKGKKMLGGKRRTRPGRRMGGTCLLGSRALNFCSFASVYPRLLLVRSTHMCEGPAILASIRGECFHQ